MLHYGHGFCVKIARFKFMADGCLGFNKIIAIFSTNCRGFTRCNNSNYDNNNNNNIVGVARGTTVGKSLTIILLRC